MSSDKVISAIERSSRTDIADIVTAAICRYREVYPEWQILFLSAETNATDQRSRELRELICRANEIIGKRCSKMNEK